MKIKNQKIILTILLSLTIIIFFVCIIGLISWIPDVAEQIFGESDLNLDHSQRILLSTQLLVNRKNLFVPLKKVNKQITFLIENGESASSVANHLEILNIIPDAGSLISYWLYKGQDRLVQSGVYLIQPKTSPIIIAAQLVNNTPEKIQFAFLPGWRIEEVEYLLINGNIFPENIKIKEIEKTSLKACFPSELSEIPSIEGFLYPEEYQIPIESSPEEILCSFSDKFFESLPENFSNIVKENGFSDYEAVILASIVEKEIVLEEEAPIIASVFINRMKADMPLQSDPTVQYAIASELDPTGWWKGSLDAADLAVDSPYNTYLNKGLPPTPICNPGYASLLAVAHPSNTEFLYFRATCDGTSRHIFSTTYQQHLDAACD